MERSFAYWLVLLIALPLTHCGYSLQSSRSLFFEKEGIDFLYLAPIENQTYEIGIENTTYNTLLGILHTHPSIRLVHSKVQADAILKGTILRVTSTIEASTTADHIPPIGTGPSDVQVATLYRVFVEARFVLKKKEEKVPVWEQVFSETKLYPANYQLGVLGTTSELINTSEKTRAIKTLIDSMMEDVKEQLFAQF